MCSQVKSFLVKKLRECETALLTTAQERDGLELTLQHIQSGIQDSVAESRRLVDDYKAQLEAKTVRDLTLEGKSGFWRAGTKSRISLLGAIADEVRAQNLKYFISRLLVCGVCLATLTARIGSPWR